MKNIVLTVLVGLLFSEPTLAGMEDDPTLLKFMLNKFEWQDADEGDALVWDFEAWVGKDINKLWLKSEVETVDGETEDAELQLLYSRAISPFWDFQAGWRRDIRPEPNQDWLVLGFEGLAPWVFETNAAVFIGESGRTAVRLDSEYFLRLTQRLYLVPELELNLHGEDDPERGIGSGVSDLELGLRLGYQFRREFAPYIGVNWEKSYGNTADYLEAADQKTEDTRLVIGIRVWF